jgi:hypothetical protein
MATWRALAPGAAYEQALAAATRRAEHVEDLDLHWYVHATLVTPAFQQAFAAEYGAVYGPAARAPELSLNGDRTIVLAVAANDAAASELPAYGKTWTLAYADGATAVAPRRIEKYEPDALFMRYFFPYWNPWQAIYRVSFPLPATGTTGGRLDVSGVGGRIRLAW